MKHADSRSDSRRPGRTADLGGASALIGRARASRRLDLQRVLHFAAARRIARSTRVPATPAMALAESPAPDALSAMSAAPAAPAPAAPAPAAPAPGAATRPPRTAAGRQPGGDANARLLERVDVTADLLRLKLSRPPGFSYAPGQHVKMGVPGLQRTYSLVSAPHEPFLEFFVELFPGGRLSEQLRPLQRGAAMAVGSRGKGKLRVDPSRPNQLMVATVTGIAPYVSVLRHWLSGGATAPSAAASNRPGAAQAVAAPRFIVLHGASHADELGYHQELRALAQQRPERLLYLPTVSRPQEARSRGWQGARGRVETLLEPTLARLGLTPENTAVFACGHPAMVDRVGNDFRRRGHLTQTEAFD